MGVLPGVMREALRETARRAGIFRLEDGFNPGTGVHQDFRFTIADLGASWSVTPSTPVTLAAYKTRSQGAGDGNSVALVALGRWYLKLRVNCAACFRRRPRPCRGHAPPGQSRPAWPPVPADTGPAGRR